MSLLFRTCARTNGPLMAASTMAKRSAHKKASIQVKLNQFIDGVGLKDEVVSVRPGLMRNILYPAKKASYVPTFNGPRNRQLELELEKAAVTETGADKTVNQERRRESASKLAGSLSSVGTLVFKRAVVPSSTNTFGSVTADDVISKLKDIGLLVERQTIVFQSEGGRIKSLGEHLVTIEAGNQSTTLKVLVEAA
ncbi:hypothetical protein CLU79DRAFT_768221 [Phycomyces nitens]|nr:hypothetical protein CLU79DRAFT_768221 [Phycomyces nitens]